MALQASGQIKYSEIIAEFGTPNSGGIGEYRISENVGSLSNLPLDIGVPQSGQIKFSDFYSKRLNQVVDLYSIGNNTSCALKTGNWDSGTVLVIEIGTSGKLYGSGGDGGTGGSANETAGTDGQTGSSALGIEYPCSINNLGVIQSGYGGGGGGGGNTRTTGGGKKSGATTNGSSGGGGGGGAGLPAGDGGGVQTPLAVGGGTAGSAGAAGSLSNLVTGAGTGGAGGSEAGTGGNASAVNNSATKADDGGTYVVDGNQQSADGGIGGNNGYAIITNQVSAPSLSGNSVTGRTVTSTNPT